MVEMVVLDVAEEILLRLPVKDLLRCKSVCKSCRSLISSPCFVKLHYTYVYNNDHDNNNNGHRRIALSHGYMIRLVNPCLIPDEWVYYSVLTIQGSSNGLVCISTPRFRICLINPSTREFRKLQKPPILPKNLLYATCFGFGYDSLTDDYKLVMAISQGCDGTLVQILSLKSGLWKLFGHVKYRFDDRASGILFNRALHWFWYNANDNARDKVFIVSFDLAKEEFKEIPQPDDTRYVGSNSNKLGIIQDRLCIYQPGNDGHPYGIWVMKNYNVKQSWEPLPNDYEMKDRVHYMINDCLHSRKMPTYFCSDNISKEMKEIEEAYCLEDGEQNEFNLEEDGETERKKRKRKRSRSRKKNSSKEKREIDIILIDE